MTTFTWFRKKLPELYLALKECDHGYNEKTPNIYHLEGSVLSHTLMVLSAASAAWPSLSTEEKLALLLHDLGKPLSMEENHEKARRSFIGHAGIGVYLALEALGGIEGLTDEAKIEILQLISWHMIFFNREYFKKNEAKILKNFAGRSSLFRKLVNINKFDAEGRLSVEDEEINHQLTCEEIDEICLRLDKTPNDQKSWDKNLILVIGPSGSGKSTYIRENLAGYRTLCRDDILMKEVAAINPAAAKSYSSAWAAADQNLIDEALLNEAKSMQDIKDVAIDMLSLSPKSRSRYINLFPRRNITFVIMLTPYPILLKNNQNRAAAGKDLSLILASQLKALTLPWPNDAGIIKYIFVR